MKKFEVRRERWGQLWPDARDLFELHRAELRQEDFALSPDHPMIEGLEASGGLICLAARTLVPERQLIGYGIWYLLPSLESRGVLLAQQGPWFVLEGWRKEGAGRAIWAAGLKTLREAGVKQALLHHSPRHQGLGKFFTRAGAKLQEIVYSLRLGEE